MQDLTPAIDIDAAARRLHGIVTRTPLMRSDWLSEATGADVWLKLEFLQHTGSFKFRGAFNALGALGDRDPSARAVTTASAGNHGLALATAAARLGLAARVHLPKSAPETKRQGLIRAGAQIVEAATYDDAEAAAQRDAARGGVTFVSAYSHSDVIAGAGTIAVEMLDDQPSLDVLLAPVGGGGLISGLAVAARSRAPAIEIVGAEAEASPVFTAALAAGRPTIVDVHDTLADGLAGNMEPDSQTFGIVRDLVARVEMVAEAAIGSAMRELIRRERLIVEGASAVTIAAMLGDGSRWRGRRAGVVLTGRNVDPATIERVLGTR
jgi:threonine dehydratase